MFYANVSALGRVRVRVTVVSYVQIYHRSFCAWLWLWWAQLVCRTEKHVAMFLARLGLGFTKKKKNITKCKEHLHMIAWMHVMVACDVGFEPELSNVASRTYWRPCAMQENEFNQWFLGDRVREK